MENLGKRLKEERERLGLSQVKLAELCGIGKTTQYMYERGERDPTAPYMQLAAKAGVDMFYVLSGSRTLRDRAHADVFGALVVLIEEMLGLDEEMLRQLTDERMEIAVRHDPSDGGDSASPDRAKELRWIKRVSEWLGTSSRPDRCIDAPLFARLQQVIGEVAAASGGALTAEKSVRAALLLYPEAKESGVIDTKRVAEVVRLATT